MSELQKEACTSSVLGKLYTRIAAVYEQLPQRFTAKEIGQLAGLSRSPYQRSGVAAILIRDFKCTQVGQGANKVWKKP
jgi:hypothetical protein